MTSRPRPAGLARSVGSGRCARPARGARSDHRRVRRRRAAEANDLNDQGPAAGSAVPPAGRTAGDPPRDRDHPAGRGGRPGARGPMNWPRCAYRASPPVRSVGPPRPGTVAVAVVGRRDRARLGRARVVGRGRLPTDLHGGAIDLAGTDVAESGRRRLAMAGGASWCCAPCPFAAGIDLRRSIRSRVTRLWWLPANAATDRSPTRAPAGRRRHR